MLQGDLWKLSFAPRHVPIQKKKQRLKERATKGKKATSSSQYDITTVNIG